MNSSEDSVTGDGDGAFVPLRRDSFVLVDPNVSNLPGFEGGSSDSFCSTVPANPVITTPSSLPHGEVAPSQRKSLPSTPVRKRFLSTTTSDSHTSTSDLHISEDVSTCTTLPYFTFSAQTCIELLEQGLLTEKQLLREYDYLSWRGCKISSFKPRPGKSMPVKLVDEMKQIFNKQVHRDFSETISTLESVTTSISYLADKAKLAAEFVDAFESAQLPSPVTVTPSRSPATYDETAFFSPDSLSVVTPAEEDFSPGSLNSTSSGLSESVCSFLSLNFTDLSVSDICDKIKFDDPFKGGRRTAYFGSLPYGYGHVTHHAQPYPEIPTFDTIFAKLQDAVGQDFTKLNYTCLVTLYPSGAVGIPSHSDDEELILPGSEIFTISVGAPRTLRFVNKSGKIKEVDVTLEHGSIFSMAAESQSDWSHSLTIENSVTEPRVSFTFRRLRELDDRLIPQHSPVPPIRPPEPVKPTIAYGTHHRILFLTDSVLKNTPEFIFNRIGGENQYRCVKKVNYELANIFNFEPEFKYSDIVVISCGINDLARYGKRPEVLADLVTRRLKDCCAKHQGTSFVFTALLSTAHGWLNKAAASFNRYMFDLSTRVPNLSFFDSHQVLLSSPLSRPRSRVPVIRSDGDGVHITFDARRLVTSQLVNALDIIVASREHKSLPDRLYGWNWPLRTAFTSKPNSRWGKGFG